MIIFGVYLSTTDIWLLSCCGVLIMALIGYRLKVSAQKIDTFNIAATTFRSKFLAEIEGLYPIHADWPGNTEIEAFLRSKFPKLQSAVEEFQWHLSGRTRKKFNKAWVEYYSATGKVGYQCYHHYMPFTTTCNVNGEQVAKDTRDICRETFKHNVGRLLSYAKQ